MSYTLSNIGKTDNILINGEKLALGSSKTYDDPKIVLTIDPSVKSTSIEYASFKDSTGETHYIAQAYGSLTTTIDLSKYVAGDYTEFTAISFNMDSYQYASNYGYYTPQLVGCTTNLDVNPIKMSNGKVGFWTKVIEFDAKDGYAFDDTHVVLKVGFGNTFNKVIGTIPKGSAIQTINFYDVPDAVQYMDDSGGTMTNHTLFDVEVPTGVSVEPVIPITPPIDVVHPPTTDKSKLIPFINIYLPTNDDLNKLSLKYQLTPDDMNIFNLIMDIYILPMVVKPLGSKNIKLGGEDTQIPSNYVDEYLYKVDMGKILVPHKYDDYRDFLNTSCKLNIPYMDVIELNAIDVIGQVIYIDYVVNLLSGKGTVIITSDEFDSPISISQINLAYKVPMTYDTMNSATQTVDDSLIENTIDVPFIEVTRNKYLSEIDGDFYGYNVGYYSRIGDLTDYNEITKTVIDVKCSKQERDLIESTLSSGIIL